MSFSRSVSLLRFFFLLTAMPLAIAGCASYSGTCLSAPPADQLIIHIDLGNANAYLLAGSSLDAQPVLVDTGFEGEAARTKIAEALATRGWTWDDLALVILTHGHGDHAGNAAWIAKQHHVPVLAGAGDTTMLAAGKNASYEILGLEARLVHWVADDTFPPLVPDIVLPAAADIRYDLRPYGLPGDVLPVAGHTAGSLVILLETGAALVGDLLRGGYLAGRLAPQRPVTHYFHEDLKSARSVLRDLVARGVHCFYVGHGGPLDGARVATWIDS